VSALKPKNPWPDSQGSIGSLLCPMGRNKCWEAVGPAGELSKGNLFKEIKKLLESQHEYLNEGESVPRAILFEVYMIGRNETFARPTILFCCERKPPRQRAMKLVRESLVLVEYPGVQLGDCSRPPNLTHQPVPLFDPISEEDDRVLVGSSPSGIIYRPPIKSLFGLPVYVQLSHDHLRAATIGGFICLGDTIVGLSVRHVFDEDQDELNPEDFGTVMEFSLEYDDFEEDVEGEGNIDSVMMTSTGISKILLQISSSNKIQRQHITKSRRLRRLRTFNSDRSTDNYRQRRKLGVGEWSFEAHETVTGERGKRNPWLSSDHISSD